MSGNHYISFILTTPNGCKKKNKLNLPGLSPEVVWEWIK